MISKKIVENLPVNSQALTAACVLSEPLPNPQLTNPEAVAALAMVMGLCLLVDSLQHSLRQALERNVGCN
ncbi:hypothetical protein QUB05_01610 [Microcoleus sp. F10-C6]|uniref:hypothetical protein n=1 Tax=unclassified Microcoleus TaxID=2642155 RepID=UPI002FD29434